MNRAIGSDSSWHKHRGLLAAAVVTFVFVCFFPNPALPIGSSTGLQAGQVLAMLSMLGVLFFGWLPRRHALAALILGFPLLFSGLIGILSGHALDGEVAINNIVATSLVLIVLIPAGWIARRRHMVPVVWGAALAILCNAAVGVYQAYWFAKDVFPLGGLYQNPSFKSLIAENPMSWAIYVKRPFGLFPEPSAMAASTGPWLVMLLGLLLYPDLRPWAARGTMGLFVLALVGGVSLILMSKSGYTLFLLGGFLLVSLHLAKDSVLRLHRPRGLFAVVGMVLVGTAVAVFSVVYLSSRVESEIEGGSSWLLRFASILQGLGYLGRSLPDLLVGAGPGQSSLVLTASGVTGSSLEGDTGVAAVWSVVAAYIQEAGLVGVMALALVLVVVLRAIFRTPFPLVGLGCLLAWLGGVVFTTSYLALLPVWVFLALLLGWDHVFDSGSGLGGPPGPELGG